MKALPLTITFLACALTGAHLSGLTHHVKRGHTLFGISKKYNVTIATIKARNSFLRRRSLRAGDRIVLPVSSARSSVLSRQKPSRRKAISVKRGDTLSGISKKYNVTIATIKARNPFLRRRSLRVGDRIVLPVSSARSSVPSRQKPSSRKAISIKRGDTLSQISRKYNVRIATIKDLNPVLKNRPLRVGDVIIVPAGALSTAKKILPLKRGDVQKKYRVKRGDTLSKISRKFNIKISSIKGNNPELKRRCLQAGDVLALHVIVHRRKKSRYKGGQSRKYKSRKTDRNMKSIAREIKNYSLLWPLSGPHRISHGKSLYIRGQPGAPVKASLPGEVFYVRDFGALGSLIALKHKDDVFSYYLHIDKSRVQKGQQVAKGQIIGTLGAHTETVVQDRRHLSHVKRTELRFEVTKGRHSVNPLKVL